MLRITITHKSEPAVTREFDKAEVTLGRGPGNDIVLASDRVSKHHAQILFNFTRKSVVVIDRRTTNGTLINGKAIEGPHPIQPGEVLTIADYTLDVSIVGEMPEPTRTEFLQPGTRRKRKPGEPEQADFDAFGDSQVIGEASSDAPPERADLAAPGAAGAAADERGAAAVAVLGQEPTRKAHSVDDVAEAADAGVGAAAGAAPGARGRSPRLAVPRPVAAAPAARPGDTDEAVRRVAACLERYIKLDDTYRAEAFGKPCVCGTCLLCEAKAALDQLNRERAERRRLR